MKLLSHSLAACFLMTTAAVHAGVPATITDVSVSGGEVNLQWDGGTAPFSIEQSADFTNWTQLLQTAEQSASIPGTEPGVSYFRVVSAPELGEYVGQLRVDEGEFGGPLARHRLKSLWDFHLPAEGQPSRIPAEYFQQLTLRLTYREGDGLKTFTGKLEDLPEAEITTAAKTMTVTWSFGEGDDKRGYILKLAFRYNIGADRDPIHLSDPRYTLTCTYADAQPEAGYRNGLILVDTLEDEVSLYEIFDDEAPRWFQRDYEFEIGDVAFAAKYAIGVPMIEGSQAFIWKTPVLNTWERTTISGLTTTPLEITDRFARTYQPGHHNFVETIWIEPSLIPEISAETLEKLRDADVRFIIATNPTAFPNASATIQLAGFDLVVRDL